MKKVDMSEQAILRRLRTVDRLRELSLSLMKAKKLSDKKNTALNLTTDLKPSTAAGGSDKNP